MSASLEVEFGVLNIAAEPHRAGTYSTLLTRISKHPRQFRGQDFAAITEPEELQRGIFMGTILIWTELDPDAPAVNKDTLEEVRFTDTKIVWPNNFGINGRHFFYVLREHDHKLFFESLNEERHHLAPDRLKHFLDRAFAPINLRGEMTVTVTVIPDEDGLKKVLAIPHITKLQIEIAPPNADQNDPVVKRVLKRLVDQGAKRQTTILDAKTRKAGIKPNKETLEDAEVAAENGSVTAVGFDKSGFRVPPRSTEQYPKIIPYTIEGAGSAIAGLIRIAKTYVLRN